MIQTIRDDAERSLKTTVAPLADAASLTNSNDSFGRSLERLRAFAAWSGAKLTAREEQVLADLLAGKTNPEIAVSLGVRTRTVAFHVSNLLYKFASASRLRLMVKWAGWSADAPR